MACPVKLGLWASATACPPAQDHNAYPDAQPRTLATTVATDHVRGTPRQTASRQQLPSCGYRSP